MKDNKIYYPMRIFAFVTALLIVLACCIIENFHAHKTVTLQQGAQVEDGVLYYVEWHSETGDSVHMREVELEGALLAKFPHYIHADSVCGLEERFTDRWCSIASKTDY